MHVKYLVNFKHLRHKTYGKQCVAYKIDKNIRVRCWPIINNGCLLYGQVVRWPGEIREHLADLVMCA